MSKYWVSRVLMSMGVMLPAVVVLFGTVGVVAVLLSGDYSGPQAFMLVSAYFTGYHLNEWVKSDGDSR